MSYRLSDAADHDLQMMFDYGVDNWGVAHTRAYLNRVTDCLAEIAANPLLFPAIEKVRAGFRRRVFEGQSIYYRVEGSTVVIVRILGRQDPDSHLVES